MYIEGEINVRNNSERELSSKTEGEKESNSKIKQTDSLSGDLLCRSYLNEGKDSNENLLFCLVGSVI